MNLHDLISREAPFIGPCCTYFPIDYRISYENTPVLSVRWKDLDPLNIQLLQMEGGAVRGFLINTLNNPIHTLSLLECFRQIVGENEKTPCCSNGYSKNIFCHGRGIYLEVFSMMPMNIQLLDDGNGFGAGGFKIRFASLDDFKDFKNLLAGILYWPLTCREYCVG